MGNLLSISLGTVSKEFGKVGIFLLLGTAATFYFYQESNIHTETMGGFHR